MQLGFTISPRDAILRNYVVYQAEVADDNTQHGEWRACEEPVVCPGICDCNE